MSKQLLFSITEKDFKIDWFSGTGAGGQHRNKHQNSCRLTHIESGIMRTGQSSRNRKQNKIEAFRGIIESKEFKSWHRIKTAKMLGKFDNIEKDIDNQMKEENLKIEVKKDGEWITEKLNKEN